MNERDLYEFIAEQLRRLDIGEFHEYANETARSENANNFRTFFKLYIKSLNSTLEKHSIRSIEKILQRLNDNLYIEQGGKLKEIIITIEDQDKFLINKNEINLKDHLQFDEILQITKQIEIDLGRDRGRNTDIDINI
jgi:hypothetical protein